MQPGWCPIPKTDVLSCLWHWTIRAASDTLIVGTGSGSIAVKGCTAREPGCVRLDVSRAVQPPTAMEPEPVPTINPSLRSLTRQTKAFGLVRQTEG